MRVRPTPAGAQLLTELPWANDGPTMRSRSHAALEVVNGATGPAEIPQTAEKPRTLPSTAANRR